MESPWSIFIMQSACFKSIPDIKLILIYMIMASYELINAIKGWRHINRQSYSCLWLVTTQPLPVRSSSNRTSPYDLEGVGATENSINELSYPSVYVLILLFFDETTVSCNTSRLLCYLSLSHILRDAYQHHWCFLYIYMTRITQIGRSGKCGQCSCRSAYACAQSDQELSCSL